MQALEDYYYLGKVIKPHGFDGKVNTYLDTDQPDFYADMEMVFININGSPVPYFVEDVILKNNKATMKFQDVDTIDQASLLIQKEMFLPLNTLPKLSGNKFYFHEVVGFKVTDKNFGEIGEIKSVLKYPNQAVFQIIHKEKEVLIPISDDVIIQVDRPKKEITVAAPEGLIDIYLL